MSQLFYGDNLHFMRDRAHFPDASVDLIYLDPPFNSKRDYNLLFKSPKGHDSDASITAFEDSWHWGQQAEQEFDELLHQPNTDVAEIVRALRQFLGENDMMAYLVMMANRLLEMHRVLKPTGSLYLHCDPTASHYLKVVLDGVFGKERFLNEITWKRTGSHGSSKRWGPLHDTLFYYSKSDDFLWTFPTVAHTDDYVQKHFKQSDEDGRLFQAISLTDSGIRSGESGKPWRHIDPTDAARDLAQRSEHDGRYQFQYWAVSLVEANPAQNKKKGADGGVDGIKFFRDLDKKDAHKVVVSVKSGKLKADDIRALGHVREREKAEIALLVTLDEPSAKMTADAASASFYKSVAGKSYARVQILTIAGLLAGTQRAEHPDYEPDLNFKKAKTEASGEQVELL